MKRFLIVLFGWVFLCTIASQAQEFTFQPVEFGEDRLLSVEPVVTGFDGAYAIVTFETMVPTPGANVYYGVFLAEGKLRVPRYRKIAEESLEEETSTTVHQIEMDISKLESVLYDTGLIENGGGVIAYRIEVFDPCINAARFYDRHFCYKREGEPKTGTYTTAVTVTEGPFVDLVTHQSAVISWETDQASDGAVFINDNPSCDLFIEYVSELNM